VRVAASPQRLRLVLAAPESLAVLARPLRVGLRELQASAAPPSGSARLIREFLPAQLARRQAARSRPVAEARPVQDARPPVRSDCPRAGTPEARSTSADPARRLVSAALPAWKRALTALVPARGPRWPARAASFRR